MQVEALPIAVVMACPSPYAATAMPEPTIARMSAYSAAEAPLSSFRKEAINLTMIMTPYWRW